MRSGSESFSTAPAHYGFDKLRTADLDVLIQKALDDQGPLEGLAARTARLDALFNARIHRVGSLPHDQRPFIPPPAEDLTPLPVPPSPQQEPVGGSTDSSTDEGGDR